MDRLNVQRNSNASFHLQIFVRRENKLACNVTLDEGQRVQDLPTFAKHDSVREGRHGYPDLFFRRLHIGTA